MRACVLAAVTCFFAFSSGVATADMMRDETTGLSVDPPGGFFATTAPLSRGATAAIDVRSEGETNSGCRVLFQPQPENEDVSQDDINAFAGTAEWREAMRASMNLLIEVQNVATIEHLGITGTEVVGVTKALPGLPDPKGIMFYYAIYDTPKGRTSAMCTDETPRFLKRRDAFAAVGRSVSPPR